MDNTRTSEELSASIRGLLAAAEQAAEKSREESGEGETQDNLNMTEDEVAKHLEGLDLLITEEATLALRAEFLRFSSVFDTNATRETIHNAVVEVTKPLLETWINRHMADIAKSVVKEAIGKIADVRKPL
ncbi:domain containing protein [Candidatus Micropelagos thuwalensis]|uniref:Domain containing protein n=1 Tax=Candidatus Micropelagius thuwalensis TaxID=1397666 RepID=U2W9Z6_9PROT|nr:DUF2497 domain-containing protein [Candidatus Micropelagos thuwalensis]ERL46394.1 domain containing protein [Candidatus Micropelagos thuwalensis]